MLLSTLGTSLLGNILAGKCTIRSCKGTIRAGEGANRACMNFKCRLKLKMRKIYCGKL